jgi:hypothetical protein
VRTLDGQLVERPVSEYRRPATALTLDMHVEASEPPEPAGNDPAGNDPAGTEPATDAAATGPEATGIAATARALTGAAATGAFGS